MARRPPFQNFLFWNREFLDLTAIWAQGWEILDSRIEKIYSAWVLKAQDLLVALHRSLHPERRQFAVIAQDLYISIGTAHRALQSAKEAQLVTDSGEAIRQNLVEFLVHGVRYAFYPIRRGENSRGVPTAGSAPGLAEELTGGTTVVWPDPHGRTRGDGLKPLYPTVPRIAANDPLFYLVLAAVDLLRIGSARERELASEILRERVLSRA